jgi:DNA-binding NarL/FixJ family response regulator
MPGVDGVTAAAEITALGDVQVIMLTTFDLDEYVYAALKAGASGFLVKDLTDEQLTNAVRAAQAGDRLLAPSVTRRLIEAYTRRPPTVAVPGADNLTPRELEVWAQVTAGRSNTEIADVLFLGEATVKTHVSRLLSKLGARDRVHLVVLGFEQGLR